MIEDATTVPVPAAVKDLSGCAARANALLLQGRLERPSEHRGRRLTFANGTTATVYRETRLRRLPPVDPAILIVGFTLRVIASPRAHAAFRVESLLNTILFVGFRGFVSKLWLAHDERAQYRGFYEWDGSEQAKRYVGALRHVLGLVSVPGSIGHRVLPGLTRDEVLRSRGEVITGATSAGAHDWWRLVDVRPPLR
ncbi:MAG: hypothetical protein OEV40_05415 [Acidimicrobiia bacterium]|nr:hypothetical protein [Acidimicrobiia bacterium]